MAIDDGFAAADALGALLILSIAATLALPALDGAHRVAVSAREVGRGELVIRHVQDAHTRAQGVATGQTQGFDWILETRSIGAARPISMCSRTVSVTSLTSGRTSRASTLVTCPDQEQS